LVDRARPVAVAVTLALLLAPAAVAAAITGTSRDDRIAAQGNGTRDQISCGAGRDVLTADLFDRFAADCEVVSRQISRDPTTTRLAQHQTEVEPDSFAFGSTIVTASRPAGASAAARTGSAGRRRATTAPPGNAASCR